MFNMLVNIVVYSHQTTNLRLIDVTRKPVTAFTVYKIGTTEAKDDLLAVDQDTDIDRVSCYY